MTKKGRVDKLPEDTGKTGMTPRAILTAILLTLFLAASSTYIALRLGAMPWPIIFAVICSGALLKAASLFGKKTNVHEINVAQAGGSIGGVLASAAAFTIPGIWLLTSHGYEIADISSGFLSLIVITAGILGILLSIPLRKTFIDEEKLPFASGRAGAEIILAGDKGGNKAFIVLFFGLLAGLFAVTRDFYHPAAFIIPALAAVGIFLYIYPMPLAVGIGYILGPMISIWSWFAGCLMGWLLIIPLLISRGWEASNAIALVQNLGMGIVLGSGIGFFVAYIVPNFGKIFMPLFSLNRGTWYNRATPYFSVAAFLVLLFVGVPWLAAVIAVLGVWIMSGIASRMTGETDIDPYEQFGIIVVLAAIMAYSALKLELGIMQSFVIVSFVTVACAVIGDIGFDYKSARIIGTKARDIIKIDLIAVVFAGLITPFVLDVIRKSSSDILFTTAMPATQAQLVAGSISGFAYPNVFLLGFAIAFLIEMVKRLKGFKTKVSMMALGIGMFIGFTLSIPFAVGGLIRYYIDKKKPALFNDGVIASAGLMGGEGIAGFTVALLVVSGFAASASLKALALIFLTGLVIASAKYLKK